MDLNIQNELPALQMQSLFGKVNGLSMGLNKSIKKGKLVIISGDLFEVHISEGRKNYIQFLYKDDNYMAGHLIRAFEYVSSMSVSPSLEEILRSKVKFYSYTRVFEGVKDGLWTIIGNVPIEENFIPPMFRQTPEPYSMVKKSYKWIIFQAGSPERKFIGKLTSSFKKLSPGGIFPPSAIVKWIETGWHGFIEPE